MPDFVLYVLFICMGIFIVSWSIGVYCSFLAFRYVLSRHPEIDRADAWRDLASGKAPWAGDPYVVRMNNRAAKAVKCAVIGFLSFPVFLFCFVLLRIVT